MVAGVAVGGEGSVESGGGHPTGWYGRGGRGRSHGERNDQDEDRENGKAEVVEQPPTMSIYRHARIIPSRFTPAQPAEITIPIWAADTRYDHDVTRPEPSIVKFRTLHHGSMAEFPSRTFGLFLIQDEQAWAARWSRLSRLDAPEVDLPREMVLYLSLGQRGTPGHEVTIENVTLDGTTLVVSAAERRPDGGYDALSFPAHAVAVTIGDRPVHDMALNLRISSVRD
jgi:hypothetical protein